MGETICLTDCTLRDGSYQNDFGFTAQETFRLSRSLDDAGFPEIEVGHGLGLCGSSRSRHVPGASDQEYIVAAREAIRRGRLGVFAIPGIATTNSIREAARLGVDFIKIGVIAGKPVPAEPLIRACAEQGVAPFVFFMQASLVPPQTLAENALAVSRWGVSTIYVADSAGYMVPTDIAAYVSCIRDRVDCCVGFHGHNNLHLAMANVISATIAGARKIDCTLRGIGRSSGNPQSEAVVLVLQRIGHHTGVDASAAINAAELHINSSMPGYGNEAIDLVVGYAGLHSRFIADVDRIAAENGISSLDLLLAVGERGSATEGPEVIADVARQMTPRSMVQRAVGSGAE